MRPDARTAAALLLAAATCVAGCTGPQAAEGTEMPEAEAEATSTPLQASASAQASGHARDTPAGALWDQGIPFSQFLEEANRRRETWHGNYDRAAPPEDLLRRANALGPGWRLLVVAEDWCGDSANTIPYLARLVEAVDGMDLRVVRSGPGAAVMEAHRTPDDRGATPTVVVLDPNGHEAGAWVERPSELQAWFLDGQQRMDNETLYERKYAWFDWDVGESTMREIVEIAEGAGRR